jgi:hypothetical protein
MRTHHDAKLMAKTLRTELQQLHFDLSHGQCLDIVARQFGLKDWNVLAARLDDEKGDEAPEKLVIRMDGRRPEQLRTSTAWAWLDPAEP